MLLQVACVVLSFVVVIAAIYVWRTFPITMSLMRGQVTTAEVLAKVAGMQEADSERLRKIEERVKNLENRRSPTAAKTTKTTRRKVTA